MKICYIVAGENKCEISKETLKYLSKITSKEFIIVDNDFKFDSLVDIKLPKDSTHICIIPNDTNIPDNYETIIKEYIDENEDILVLPLISLKNTGVLNSCLWVPSLNSNVGELDFELASKQIDTTLYCSLIPISYLNKEYFSEEIKYYKHFYFLNKVTKDEKIVIGVPKLLAQINIDLSFKDVSTEEKQKDYMNAKKI